MNRHMLTACLILAATAAASEVHEVKMLNIGEQGRMVFEPAALQLAPGDTVKFLATDRGHNAETIDGMIPAGAEPFRGKINEEIEVTFATEGLYAVMCRPHYAMGMVMLISVGDAAEAPEGFFEGRIPRMARERFDAQMSGF